MFWNALTYHARLWHIFGLRGEYNPNRLDALHAHKSVHHLGSPDDVVERIKRKGFFGVTPESVKQMALDFQIYDLALQNPFMPITSIMKELQGRGFTGAWNHLEQRKVRALRSLSIDPYIALRLAVQEVGYRSSVHTLRVTAEKIYGGDLGLAYETIVFERKAIWTEEGNPDRAPDCRTYEGQPDRDMVAA